MRLIIFFIAITYNLGHNNINIEEIDVYSFLVVYKAGFFLYSL